MALKCVAVVGAKIEGRRLCPYVGEFISEKKGAKCTVAPNVKVKESLPCIKAGMFGNKREDNKNTDSLESMLPPTDPAVQEITRFCVSKWGIEKTVAADDAVFEFERIPERMLKDLESEE